MSPWLKLELQLQEKALREAMSFADKHHLFRQFARDRVIVMSNPTSSSSWVFEKWNREVV